MAGSMNIDKIYIQTFEENVQNLAQQTQSKLRQSVMTRAKHSEKHNWEILDYSDAVSKTTSAPPTPALDLPWNRRTSIAQTMHTGTVIDNEDIVQMLVEPKSAATQNLVMSMNRSVDDIIIAAATGPATLGDGTTIALPGSQIIGDGTTPISFDAITAIQEQFMNSDVDPAEPKVAIIGPAQVRKLMQLTEQTSMDYARVPAGAGTALTQLNASGIVPNWMGFTWILSTRLNAPAAGELNCLFYCQDALGLHIAEDITVQVAQDPSASFAWRIYARLTMGSVRVQDKKIVAGHFLDSL